VRNNSADTKVSEGGGEGASGTRAEVPLQPIEKTMVKQVVSLQPVEDHTEQICTYSPWKAPRQSSWAPKGSHRMGSPHWSRLLAGPVDPWREEPTLEQSAP